MGQLGDIGDWPRSDKFTANSSGICTISAIHAIFLHLHTLFRGKQMLLRFGVANHLSICERQELTLAASSLKDRDEGLITSEFVPRGAVLPAALIYGANASGKSNLLNALSTMRRMVLNSHTVGRPGEGVDRTVFRLDPKCAAKPTCFDIDFVIDGIRYHYGFEATDEAFTAEWLHQYPKSHSRLLFDRRDGQFRFGRWLKGSNSNIAKLTRPNSLFLSAAVQNDHALLSNVYQYFRSLEFDVTTTVSGWDVSRRFWQVGIDERTVRFLDLVNTGVVGHRVSRLPDSSGEANLDLLMRLYYEEMFDESDTLTYHGRVDGALELAHQGQGGRPFYFDLNMESAGTRRLLIVLGKAFKALDSGSLLCVDELDASLHTRVGEAMLELFCSTDTNPNGAQLIATTHDTNLLACSSIRRDQLWFVEKSPVGASEVYPLTDIRTRRGDNIELGYLQGRYGAIPVDPTLAELIGAT